MSSSTFRDEKGSNNKFLGNNWYVVSFIAFCSLITLVVLAKGPEGPVQRASTKGQYKGPVQRVSTKGQYKGSVQRASTSVPNWPEGPVSQD